MATFRATFCQVQNQTNASGKSMPVLRGRGAVGLTELTTSGTAGNVQSGGSDFTAPRSGYVTVVCDGAVWVKFATDPTAAVGDAYYLKADERMEFSLETGDKISVIDDS